MLERKELVAILKSGGGVVDRAGADDDEEASVFICACDNCDGFIAPLENSRFGFCGLGNFVLQKIRRGQRVIASNCRIERLVIKFV